MSDKTKNSTIKAITKNGETIYIDVEIAYYIYRLTIEDIFTLKDCNKVLESMNKYQIEYCQDSMSMIYFGNSFFFTKNEILELREYLLKK